MDRLLFLNLGTPELIMLSITFALPFILTVICLIDIVRSSFQDPINKVLWTVIVLLAPVLGALAYLIWGKKQKIRTNDAI